MTAKDSRGMTAEGEQKREDSRGKAEGGQKRDSRRRIAEGGQQRKGQQRKGQQRKGQQRKGQQWKDSRGKKLSSQLRRKKRGQHSIRIARLKHM
jgi:hypothetical protein